MTALEPRPPAPARLLPKPADWGVRAPSFILAHHYACLGVDSGNTELPVSQLLYALAIANRSQTIVETGINNFAGASLWLVEAARINDGTYTGFDISYDPCVRAARLLTQLEPSPNATIIHGDALIEVPARFSPGTIDLLFVDDCHKRLHVEREIAAFRPLMRPNGLMLFHDVLGVHESDIWDVLAALGGVRLATHPHEGKHFGGLGMLPCP